MTFSRVSEKYAYEGKLIYHHGEESFCYEPFLGTGFSLMLGCSYLELDISVNTMEIINVSGLCPKRLWISRTLLLPLNIVPGSVKFYSEEELVSGTGKYLSEYMPIYFDESSNWCCISNDPDAIPDQNIEFLKDCIISLSEGEFIALWLRPEYRR